MRLLAARESQVRRRHVGDRPVQEIAADGLDLHRLGADERKDHRHVVWGEGPQDVLLAPDLSEVEAARIDILQPSEPALAHEVAQLQERRVVLQDVPDHEAPVEPLGEGAKLLRLLDLQRQRLLEEDVFAGRQGLLAERVVLRRRRCAGDGLDRRVGEDGLERRGASAELGRESRDPLLVRVDKGRQRTDFGVVADVVLPPRPAADDGDANAAGGRAARFRRRRARPAAPREGIHDATCYPSNAAKAKPQASDDGCRKLRFRSKTAGKVAQWAFAVKNCPG